MPTPDTKPLTKGYLVDLSTPDWERLEFQYNPGEITDDTGLQAKDVVIVGGSHPKMIPAAGGERAINFQLYFHWTSVLQEQKEVKERCQWLQSLRYPIASEKGNFFPPVQFVYGDLYDLTVRVMKVRVKYPGRFDATTLLPWRAFVDITLKEQVSELVTLSRARAGEVYAHYDPGPTQMFYSAGVI